MALKLSFPSELYCRKHSLDSRLAMFFVAYRNGSATITTRIRITRVSRGKVYFTIDGKDYNGVPATMVSLRFNQWFEVCQPKTGIVKATVTVVNDVQSVSSDAQHVRLRIEGKLNVVVKRALFVE